MAQVLRKGGYTSPAQGHNMVLVHVGDHPLILESNHTILRYIKLTNTCPTGPTHTYVFNHRFIRPRLVQVSYLFYLFFIIFF